MFCELSKKKISKIEYYVSLITGNKYSYHDYINSDANSEWCIKHTPWKKALPKDEYPYDIEYSETYLYKCCELCTKCEKY